MAKKKKDSSAVDEQKDSSFVRVCHPNAAGIDVGSNKHYVAVPVDRDKDPVKSFSGFTQDLHQMAQWLIACKIDTVAMESTGSYWISLYCLLEEYGIEVYLINPSQCKRMPGRKTDVYDCQWLQQLHSYGLLANSFHPTKQIRQLRSYMRQRDSLIKDAATQIHRMQKCLTQMNIKLHHVISELTGKSGMAILQAILSGERNAQHLADLCDGHIKASREDIVKSLEGSYDEDQMVILAQCYRIYENYQNEIKTLDEIIKSQLDNFQTKANKEDKPKNIKPRKKQPKNAFGFDIESTLYSITGVDVSNITGIRGQTALTILSETGTDMSKWPTSKHFVSWLGLSPNNKISGDKVISRKSRRIKSKASIAFRMAAQGVSQTKTALGAFYRRLRAKTGPGIANVATARKIASMYYKMLKEGVSYIEQGEVKYLNLFRDKQIKYLNKKASQLGFALVQA